MTELNSATFADLAAAGVDPAMARELVFWRPYQSWDQLLLVDGVDEPVLEQLRARGFEIAPRDDTAFTAPKPFRLSVAA